MFELEGLEWKFVPFFLCISCVFEVWLGRLVPATAHIHSLCVHNQKTFTTEGLINWFIYFNFDKHEHTHKNIFFSLCVYLFQINVRTCLVVMIKEQLALIPSLLLSYLFFFFFFFCLSFSPFNLLFIFMFFHKHSIILNEWMNVPSVVIYHRLYRKRDGLSNLCGTEIRSFFGWLFIVDFAFLCVCFDFMLLDSNELFEFEINIQDLIYFHSFTTSVLLNIIYKRILWGYNENSWKNSLNFLNIFKLLSKWVFATI